MAEPRMWQILFIDDDAEACQEVKEWLEREKLSGSDDRLVVHTLTDFESALEELAQQRTDIVILDIKQEGNVSVSADEEAGIVLYERIRQQCFVPVVFYTGLPRSAPQASEPLIHVVRKTDGVPSLQQAVEAILATGLPGVNRALLDHIRAIQRAYMWDFVVSHWEHIGSTPDRRDLAYLLARRLALSLSGPGVASLAQDLGDTHSTGPAGDNVPPMRLYIMPPLDDNPRTGDLYRRYQGDDASIEVLLTPACDLVHGKASRVLLARCEPLEKQQEYCEWRGSQSNTKKEALDALLRNDRKRGQADRYHYLPAAINVPDLVVDFQQLEMVGREVLDGWERIATLDSPFAEAVTARFVRYYGRLGAPDLDLCQVFDRLSAQAAGSPLRP